MIGRLLCLLGIHGKEHAVTLVERKIVGGVMCHSRSLCEASKCVRCGRWAVLYWYERSRCR